MSSLQLPPVNIWNKIATSTISPYPSDNSFAFYIAVAISIILVTSDVSDIL